MDPREQRGLIIAATSRNIRRKSDNLWSVPSQSGTSGARPYLVNPEKKTCTCLDFQEAGHHCKHLYAVQFVIQREFQFDEETGVTTETETVMMQTVKKTTYQQDWASYDAAQMNEKSMFQTLLRDLCKGIVEPKNATGRPRIPLDDAIFAAVFKVYSTVSGRRYMTDLREAFAKGQVSRMPAKSSVFAVLESPATTDVLKALIEESSIPLKTIESHFSCDSSGFSGSRFDRWFDHKWGEVKIQRAWVKAHIMCGAKTNVITAVEIHEQYANDSAQLKPLLNSTTQRFDVKELSADLAYSSVTNLQAIVDAGAAPLIPFKCNAKPLHPGVWNKAYHYFQMKRDEFLARYHQRSNVESTFSMLKAKFGDSVRSKTDVAMKNEVLAKILCHNLCCLISAVYELGIAPTFWTEIAPVQKASGA